MKKEDAVDSVERAGEQINEIYGRILSVALNPTEHGWPASLASIAAIPVLSTASFGHMVSSAAVRQISPRVFDVLPDLCGGKRDE
jgi:hypothetical protein